MNILLTPTGWNEYIYGQTQQGFGMPAQVQNKAIFLKVALSF